MEVRTHMKRQNSISAKAKKKSVQLNQSPDLINSKRYSQQIYGAKKASAKQGGVVNTPKYKVLTKSYGHPDNIYNMSVSARQKSISNSS